MLYLLAQGYNNPDGTELSHVILYASNTNGDMPRDVMLGVFDSFDAALDAASTIAQIYMTDTSPLSGQVQIRAAR